MDALEARPQVGASHAAHRHSHPRIRHPDNPVRSDGVRGTEHIPRQSAPRRRAERLQQVSWRQWIHGELAAPGLSAIVGAPLPLNEEGIWRWEMALTCAACARAAYSTTMFALYWTLTSFFMLVLKVVLRLLSYLPPSWAAAQAIVFAVVWIFDAILLQAGASAPSDDRPWWVTRSCERAYYRQNQHYCVQSKAILGLTVCVMYVFRPLPTVGRTRARC